MLNFLPALRQAQRDSGEFFSGINSLKWHKMTHLNANGTYSFFGSKSWFSFEIEIKAPGLQFIVSLINYFIMANQK